MRQYAAEVSRILVTCQQTGILATVGQFYHAVVTQTKPLGKICHGKNSVLWRAGNLQQELMLLGLQVRLGGGLFTEMQKAAQFVTKLGEDLKSHHCMRAIRLSIWHDIYIVSRYKSREREKFLSHLFRFHGSAVLELHWSNQRRHQSFAPIRRYEVDVGENAQPNRGADCGKQK